MYMSDWIERLDDYLRMTGSEILTTKGTISHQLAEQKAKDEYEKFRAQHSSDLTPVEAEFVKAIDGAEKKLLKRGTPNKSQHRNK